MGASLQELPSVPTLIKLKCCTNPAEQTSMYFCLSCSYLLDPGLAHTATKMVNPRETRWAVAPKTALRDRYIRDSVSIVRAMADGLDSSTDHRLLIFHSPPVTGLPTLRAACIHFLSTSSEGSL